MCFNRPARALCFTAALAALAAVPAGCRAPRADAPSAGNAAPGEALTRCMFRRRMFEEFSGYTDAGRVRGTYRMADGTQAEDESIVLWVALPPERLGTLRRALAQLAAELGQESMYLERGGAVELVQPGGQ